MTNAIQNYDAGPDASEFTSMWQQSQLLSKAVGFIPSNYVNKPEALLACIMKGRELGIPPMAAMSGIHVISGRAELSAEMMGAVVRRAGHRIVSDVTEHGATVTIKRGDDGTEHTASFSLEDAQKAGLRGENWTKYPQDMMYARALSRCARRSCQDVLIGAAYAFGELQAEESPAPTAPKFTRREPPPRPQGGTVPLPGYTEPEPEPTPQAVAEEPPGEAVLTPFASAEAAERSDALESVVNLATEYLLHTNAAAKKLGPSSPAVPKKAREWVSKYYEANYGEPLDKASADDLAHVESVLRDRIARAGEQSDE